jgi:REP element-mobilizing transposase RayT
VPPDARREEESRQAMTQAAYVMNTPAEREVVCKTIVDLCRKRGWRLLAVHVRTNHVHIVLCTDQDPGRVMSDIKARASRELTRAGFDDENRKRWTRHGSALHLFDAETVDEKIDYTLHRQGRPMAWYDGR